MKVAEFEPPHRFLNVCASGEGSGRNCSRCFECCRTLLTLEILGQTEAFAGVFDLDAYQQERRRFVRKVLKKDRKNPLNREILELASKMRFKL